jgi:hypothetical protein
MPSELITAHDMMLEAGNAAFDVVRDIGTALADQFDAGEFPGLTPADAVRLLVASLPRRVEVDVHKDRADGG